MHTLTGKKILILGGDPFSVDIVKTAKEMGLYTIVTDWYDTHRSPAKLVADEYWDISIEAYDELVQQIHTHHVDGILTGFTDSYLVPYQHLCEQAGLPSYGTRAQFECLTDKRQYKELCQQFGVPTTRMYQPHEDMVFPVMVKPVDGSGSRGITICHHPEEVTTAIALAQEFSKKSEVLIEEYMDMPEVTVFWLFIDGQYYVTTIGNRHIKHQGDGLIPLPVGYTFPSQYTQQYIDEVADHAKQMFQHIGIQNGMLFMQCKVKNGTAYVYDIGYRLTGSLEYKILEQTCQYNPLKMLIHFAVTGQMTTEDIRAKIQPVSMPIGYNVSCLCQPGTIQQLIGIDEVRSHPGVIDVLVSHFPGDTITEAMRGRLAQITVRVLGTVPHPQDLLPMMNTIENKIRVLSDQGTNMRLPGITQQDIQGIIEARR